MAEISFSASPQRRIFAHFPWHLAFVTLAISVIGIWNLASASRSAHAPVWIQQSWFMGAGAILALGICLFDTRTFQRLAWLAYGGTVGLLLLVFVKGKVVMGARRWLDLGPINLQPSELAKLAVALALAAWFSHDAEKRGKEGYGLTGLLIPFAIILLPAVLTLKQPDLGTALIIVATGMTQVLFARVRWKTLAVLATVAVSGAVFVYPHLKPYQKKRVETFLDPGKDALGAGYHATQSMIAVGSGQGFGKGWGQGTQTYLSFLPEQHTDFIFSVWAEERGFVGCLLLLALYFVLIASAIEIAGNARDRFGSFLAVGLVGMLFWQVTINVGMVTGVLPVVGVTLPLMSYGGSSVLVIYAAMGLLANLGMRRFVN
ncbi:MAG: rod shape-determining protein RodA [Anaeromyxobacter sp.]